MIAGGVVEADPAIDAGDARCDPGQHADREPDALGRAPAPIRRERARQLEHAAHVELRDAAFVPPPLAGHRARANGAVACWVVVGAEAVREPAVRELYELVVRQLIAEFESILRDAMQKEGGSGARAREAAVTVVAAMEGFFRLATGAPSCVPPGTAAASLRAIAEGFVSADVREAR